MRAPCCNKHSCWLESNLVLGSHYIPEDSGRRMGLAAMVSSYLENADGASALDGRRLAVLGYGVSRMLAVVPFHTTTSDVCNCARREPADLQPSSGA